MVVFLISEVNDTVVDIIVEVGILKVVVVVVVDVVVDVVVVVVIVVVVVVVVVLGVGVIFVDVAVVVVVVVVVLVVVDAVDRIVKNVETPWLLSLGVTALFGMLITLVTLNDSDQELETLLLVCHIPCYVSHFQNS